MLVRMFIYICRLNRHLVMGLIMRRSFTSKWVNMLKVRWVGRVAERLVV